MTNAFDLLVVHQSWCMPDAGKFNHACLGPAGFHLLDSFAQKHRRIGSAQNHRRTGDGIIVVPHEGVPQKEQRQIANQLVRITNLRIVSQSEFVAALTERVGSKMLPLLIAQAAEACVTDSQILLQLTETVKGRVIADRFVGSSRVDLQACKLEYSIVSPK